MGARISGDDDPVWFLALYLPGAWQWVAIAVMIALGLATYGLVTRTYLRRKGGSRRLRKEKERSSRQKEKQPESSHGPGA